MAGSYAHAVNDDGALLEPVELQKMMENMGDAYECIEELYGMVWFLARQLELPIKPGMSKDKWVKLAKDNYRRGVELSPTARPPLF